MRKTKAKFHVQARIDNQPCATVIIDEKAGLISVRPYRRRREYTLPLVNIARFIIAQVVYQELAEKRRSRVKKAKRGLMRKAGG